MLCFSQVQFVQVLSVIDQTDRFTYTNDCLSLSVPDSGLSDNWIIGICAAVVIILVVLAAISMICGWCKLLLCWW